MQILRAAVVIRTFGIPVAILWATLAVAAAQGTTGSISGFVTDESNAALPGATVIVKDVDTGQSRTLTTDEQGRYRADALVPGKYAVTVELSGFRTAQYQDIGAVGRAGQRAQRAIADRRTDRAGRGHRGSHARRDPANRRLRRWSTRTRFASCR